MLYLLRGRESDSLRAYRLRALQDKVCLQRDKEIQKSSLKRQFSDKEVSMMMSNKFQVS